MIAATIAQRATTHSLRAHLRPDRVPSAAAAAATLTRCAFSAHTSPAPAPSTVPEETARPKAISPHYTSSASKSNNFQNQNTSSSGGDSSDYVDVQNIGFTNILKSLSNLEMDNVNSDGAEEKTNELTKPKKHRYWKKKRNMKRKQFKQKQTDANSSHEDLAAVQDDNQKPLNAETTSEIKHIIPSEWLLIINTPPMSKLSDLLPSLSNILHFEINKGIIDLDELLATNNDNDIEFKDPAYYTALKEMNALNSLYTTQDLASSNLPLLQLNLNPEKSLPSQLISETRLHLSPRARPSGWFLRFQNKSIAHAVQCHVNEAERHADRLKRKCKYDRMGFRSKRNQWVAGLWKKVREDYHVEKTGMQLNVLTREDDEDERALMWGEDVVSNYEDAGDDVDRAEWSNGDNILGVDEAASTASTVVEEEDDEFDGDIVDRFYDEYSQLNPYPHQSTFMPSDESAFDMFQLKCGSSICKVNGFSPATTPTEKDWVQCSFHIGELLDLSDSVVRVDTRGLKTSVDSIKYLFRAYDFKSIYPGSSSDGMEELQSSFADLPKSIGWNLRNYETMNPETPTHAAVDLLIAGRKRTEFRPANGQPTTPTNHTFLIRFATPSDARMAVREMQGKVYENYPILLTQYPNGNVI